MKSMRYKENQTFRQWDVIVMFGSLLLLMLVAFANKIWLDPMSITTGNAIFLSIISVAGVLSFVYLLSLRLVVVVDEKYVKFQYYPWHYKKQKIALDDIKSVTAVETSLYAQYSGWNIQYGPRTQSSYTVNGQNGLEVKLHSGQTIFIGSSSPRELADFVDKVLG